MIAIASLPLRIHDVRLDKVVTMKGKQILFLHLGISKYFTLNLKPTGLEDHCLIYCCRISRKVCSFIE